eukprot:gnl/TRDRNA2_/TRDRNA2_41783_c0_seq1.p1 gnl/TRDRNA2_/TRDRNA2_41783_c0~~gnl/TRDRNA2_/TRDRNA2_41783_c0_seq1.p1  ORF type:complete len:383 (-),score=57.07 gnl/TRDRNA2_/TRDRNA2_41783_c0_seq1:149-1297(-)
MHIVKVGVVLSILSRGQSQGMAKDTVSVQKQLVHELNHRGQKTGRLHHTDFDCATLAKTRHIGMPTAKHCLVPVVSSTCGPARLPGKVRAHPKRREPIKWPKESSLPRRALVEAAVLTASLRAWRAKADTDYNVRLEDVANPKTRAAVEAADRGDFNMAEELFAQVVKDEPSSASAYSNLGNVQMSLGKYKEAKISLTKAVELAPGAPVPRLNRAIALQNLGELEAADEDCTYAISLDPKEFAAWHNRGQIQADMGNWEKAVEDFQRSADLAPGIAGYRLKEALSRWQTGDVKVARRLLTSLTRKYANYAEARAALAALLYSVGEEGAAEQNFTLGSELDPSMERPASYARVHKWPPVVTDALRTFKACTGRRACVELDEVS